MDPGGHRLQFAVPGSDAVEPAAQGVQLVAPVSPSVLDPGSQGVHLPAPTALYDPAAHGTQAAIEVACVTFDDVPATHCVHDPLAAADHAPAPQGVHDPELAKA